jgi:hypothetical protein
MTVVDWTATDGEHSSINDVTNVFRRNRRNYALAPQVISTLLRGANKTFKGTVCPAPAPPSRVSMDFASVGGFRDVASSLPLRTRSHLRRPSFSPTSSVIPSILCPRLAMPARSLAMAPRPGRIRGRLTPLRATSRWLALTTGDTR